MRSVRNGIANFVWRSWLSSALSSSAARFHPARSQSAFFTTGPPDRVDVPVGSSGTVALDIHHPPSPSTSPPAIIYLPRGPLGEDTLPQPSSLATLALSANVTVIRVNYRLSRDRRYPLPVHDVAAGFDWVTRHLVHGDNGHRDLDKAFGRVGICGELFGGSLAAALALTECHTRKAGIRAAVFGNPITDWTAIYPVAKPGQEENAPLQPFKKKRKAVAAKVSWEAFAKSPLLSSAAVLKARNTYFTAPEDYFDPFASPLLFFKTPMTEVPPAVDPIDEVFAELDLSLRAFEKKRRSQRRYPGSDAYLRLPDARFWVGDQCVLRDQGIELAQGMARSNNLHGGPDGKGEGSGWERVEVQVKDGIGVWGETEFTEMGQWFGKVLRVDWT